MKKEKKIFAKVYLNGSYISAMCGKCEASLSIDATNIKPSEYYKYCQRCGEEVRISSIQVSQVKKEKDIYEKGFKEGKERGKNEMVKDEIKDIINTQLKSIIEETIEDMLPEDQDLEDIIGEVTSSTKKSIFAHAFKSILTIKKR